MPSASSAPTTPEFVISFHLLVPVLGPTLVLITYPGAATGNEKSEPMISSSDGGPVQFVVQIAASPLPSFSFRRRD